MWSSKAERKPLQAALAKGNGRVGDICLLSRISPFGSQMTSFFALLVMARTSIWPSRLRVRASIATPGH